MKLILSIVLILTTSFAAAPERNVYICNGPKSVAYHLTNECKGLSRCSTNIQEVSENFAIKKGRRLCRICGK